MPIKDLTPQPVVVPGGNITRNNTVEQEAQAFRNSTENLPKRGATPILMGHSGVKTPANFTTRRGLGAMEQTTNQTEMSLYVTSTSHPDLESTDDASRTQRAAFTGGHFTNRSHPQTVNTITAIPNPTAITHSTSHSEVRVNPKNVTVRQEQTAITNSTDLSEARVELKNVTVPQEQITTITNLTSLSEVGHQNVTVPQLLQPEVTNSTGHSQSEASTEITYHTTSKLPNSPINNTTPEAVTYSTQQPTSTRESGQLQSAPDRNSTDNRKVLTTPERSGALCALKRAVHRADDRARETYDKFVSTHV